MEIEASIQKIWELITIYGIKVIAAISIPFPQRDIHVYGHNAEYAHIAIITRFSGETFL
jgi:hypothetical protein